MSDFPFLADLARLEWALNDSYFAGIRGVRPISGSHRAHRSAGRSRSIRRRAVVSAPHPIHLSGRRRRKRRAAQHYPNAARPFSWPQFRPGRPTSSIRAKRLSRAVAVGSPGRSLTQAALAAPWFTAAALAAALSRCLALMSRSRESLGWEIYDHTRLRARSPRELSAYSQARKAFAAHEGQAARLPYSSPCFHLRADLREESILFRIAPSQLGPARSWSKPNTSSACSAQSLALVHRPELGLAILLSSACSARARAWPPIRTSLIHLCGFANEIIWPVSLLYAVGRLSLHPRGGPLSRGGHKSQRK